MGGHEQDPRSTRRKGRDGLQRLRPVLRWRESMNAALRNILLGAVGVFLLLILIALLVVLTGGYNVAATDRHNPIVAWALTTTMRNHVQNAADDLTAPAEITPAMIAAGARDRKSTRLNSSH